MTAKERLMEKARQAGSTATTVKGAVRYLRQQIRVTPIRPIYRCGHPVRSRTRLDYDRQRDQRRAERIATAVGLWNRDDAERLARRLTPFPDLTKTWPYRRAQSRWAGGDHMVSITIGAPDAGAVSERVWSSNGKWSGTNSHASITVTARAVQYFPTLLHERVLILDAEAVAPRVLRVVYVQQGRGVSLTVGDGFLIRGHLTPGTDLRRALATVTRRRQKAAMTHRNTRWAKRQRANALSLIWVTAEDSHRGGNCRAATAQYGQELQRLLHTDGPVGAIRADVLLGLRDDSFTRRAVSAAQSR